MHVRHVISGPRKAASGSIKFGNGIIERFWVACSGSPLRRLGTPATVANAVAFLTSAEGAFIHGQYLAANDGSIYQPRLFKPQTPTSLPSAPTPAN